MTETRWSRTSTPDVLDTITLTSDERSRFRNIFRIKTEERQLLIQLIQSMAAERAERENELWDEIAKKFSYADKDTLLNAGRTIELSWHTGTLNLRGKRGEPEDAGAAETVG